MGVVKNGQYTLMYNGRDQIPVANYTITVVLNPESQDPKALMEKPPAVVDLTAPAAAGQYKVANNTFSVKAGANTNDLEVTE